MADPEIKIAVTADVSQAEQALNGLENTAGSALAGGGDASGVDTLANAIERVAEVCKRFAADAAGFDLTPVKNQFRALQGVDAEMGGLTDALAAFETRLLELGDKQRESAEGCGDLRSALLELLAAYQAGEMTQQEAAAQFVELGECVKAQGQTMQELRGETRELGKDQRAMLDSKKEELEAWREGQAAADAELKALEDVIAKKQELKAIEAETLDQLKADMEELAAEREKAAEAGNKMWELDTLKQEQEVIAVYEKKEAAHTKATEKALAEIEKMETARRREAASIEELEKELADLREAYQKASEAGNAQEAAEAMRAEEQVASALERKQKEAEKAAAALEKAAQAAQKEAEAAKKEAEAAEATARKMKLANMSARELTIEISKLSAARKEARRTGDVEQYQRLTQQLGEAKRAMADMKKEANIAKTALLGKAQAGMQAAQQLGSLAEQVRSGNVDIGNMINSVMSLSMAIKAGLGPIGWVMAAIQGLQMAYNAFCGTTEKVEDRLKKLEEAHKRVEKAADDAAKRSSDKAAEAQQKEIDKIKEKREQQQKANAEALRQKRDEITAAEQLAAAEDAAQKARIRSTLQAEEQKAAEMAKTNAQAAEEYMAQARAKAQADIEAIDRAAAARQRANAQVLADEQECVAKADAKAASDAVKAIKAEMAKDDGLNKAIKDAVLPAEGELEHLRARIEELNERKKTYEAYTDRVANYETGGIIAATLLNPLEAAAEVVGVRVTKNVEKLGVVIGLGVDNLLHEEENRKARDAQLTAIELHELETLKDQLAEREATLRRIRHRAGLEGVSLDEVEQIARARQKRLETLKGELKDARQVLADGRTERDAARAAAKTQQQVNKTKVKTAEVEEQTAAASREASLRAAEAQRKEADLEEQWHEKQKGNLEEQERWLRETCEQLEEGSLLWKKYKEQLQSVQKSRISDELGKLGGELKITGNYAKKASRSEKDIWQEDMRILREKERRLYRLLASPGLDWKTEEKINKELRETRRQIDGLEQTMAKSSLAARKWLKELEPPHLKAKRKGLQKNLDRLAKGYKRAAARAAKASEKGDTKGLDRAKRSMDVYARSMGRLAEKPKVVDKMHQESLQKLSWANKSLSEMWGAQKETAKAAKETAKAQKRAAKRIKEATPDEKLKDANIKLEKLTGQMQRAEKAMAEMAHEAAELKAAITALANTSTRGVQLTEQTATAAARANDALKKRIEKCEQAINRLRTKK